VIGVRIQTMIDKAEAYWQVGPEARTASPWRRFKAQAGGGVVLMNSSHALDGVRWITGLEVVRVAGEIGTTTAGVEVEDTAAAVLTYSNGALGSLFAGAHLAGAHAAEGADIYGTLGQLRLPYPYNNDPLQAYLRRGWEDLAAGEWHSLNAGPASTYAGTVDDFARAVQQGAPPPISGRDARAVLAIVLGLYEASARKQVVTL
jgi:predicted dehydrogenase